MSDFPRLWPNQAQHLREMAEARGWTYTGALAGAHMFERNGQTTGFTFDMASERQYFDSDIWARELAVMDHPDYAAQQDEFTRQRAVREAAA